MTEVIVMHFGRPILHAFTNKNILLTISLLITMTRMYVFYLIPRNPDSIYVLFAIETILRGPNLATIVIAGIDIGSEVAGVGMQSTAQGVFWAGFMGVSGVAASLVGGWVIGNGRGLEDVFGVSAGVCSAAVVAMGAGIMWNRER
jgi:hypothetical protein